MTDYTYTETYNGSDITVDVHGNTGTAATPDGATAATHTVEFFIGEDSEVVDTTATTANIQERILNGLQALRATIDGLDDAELARLLESLGFTEITNTLPTPSGFSASPGAGSGEIDLTWTNDTDVVDYKIFISTMADHSDAYQIESGALTPHTITGLITGTTYYMRLKGTAPTWNDSPFADDDAVAT